jgi:hypothetical protein
LALAVCFVALRCGVTHLPPRRHGLWGVVLSDNFPDTGGYRTVPGYLISIEYRNNGLQANLTCAQTWRVRPSDGLLGEGGAAVLRYFLYPPTENVTISLPPFAKGGTERLPENV